MREKTWLINEIEIMGSETSENYPHEQMVDREEGMKLIDQLDEPVKVVIPQFVATFIEDSRNKVGNIVTAIWDMYTYEHKDIYEWSLEDNNDEVLMQAFANGCEIEKEKLYYVIIPTKDKSWKYYYLDHDGGIDMENNLKYVHSHTEDFIRSVSDDLWAFAKDVAE